jgi:RNA recognition motif-containing protein
MRVDRFNFQNDTMCFVEVGSEAEATKVMEEFSGLEIHGRKMLAQPLKSDFIWGKLERPKESPWPSRYFYDEGTAAFDAARPLLERRRMMLSVQTPGWSPGARIAIGKQQAAQIIERYFGKYGIERISDFSPFYGDLKSKPRMLCFIDFTTKEGAENAVNDLNNTEIEGRLTWLKPSDPAAWRHDQIGKVAPELLKELQESGVVSKDEQISEDKFVNPLPKQ